MTPQRPAELRGQWYPASAAECAKFLDAHPARGEVPLSRITGAIVPHGGWTYSGPLAARAIAEVARANPNPELVIVFGGHLEARDKPRILIDGAWETPFGPLETPAELAEDFSMAVECELETCEEFYDDNALEVLMPMIKRYWSSVQVVTIGVAADSHAGKLGAEILGLARRRKYERIVVLGSTDLTHYGPDYNYRPQGAGQRALDWVKEKNDPQIIAAIEEFDAAKVVFLARQSRNACSAGAIAASLAACGKLGATRAVTIGYTTSFDARPNEAQPTSFVGYAAMLLGE